MTDTASTRAEVCAVACAKLFRDAGDIMVSPMTNMASVGARLARLTFSPDILLTDGEAQLLADTPALGGSGAVEGWMPFGRVFETLSWGRRHVVMGANQVDRYGNQNISAFGPLQHPTRQMFGLRGAPGNAINHATSYWVGSHSKRVFCDAVDVVCGVGWDKVDTDNPAFRFANTYRVVSNLGVFDFSGPNHTMRALSLHPGVSPDDVRENTSFEVHGLDEADETRLPTDDELRLIREAIDPKALRTQRYGHEIAHAADRAGRDRAPGGVNRDGVGSRRPAGFGDGQRWRAGHFGVGHHDTRRTGHRDREGQGGY